MHSAKVGNSSSMCTTAIGLAQFLNFCKLEILIFPPPPVSWPTLNCSKINEMEFISVVS